MKIVTFRVNMNKIKEKHTTKLGRKLEERKQKVRFPIIPVIPDGSRGTGY